MVHGSYMIRIKRSALRNFSVTVLFCVFLVYRHHRVSCPYSGHNYSQLLRSTLCFSRVQRKLQKR